MSPPSGILMFCRNVAVADFKWLVSFLYTDYFAASSSLLNYLTWYHHAIYFKKITKASHKPNYPYEMKKKPRKRQSSACVQKILRASVSFSPDEKAKPVNSPAKKIHGLLRYLLEITSSEVFMSGYQALKCITILLMVSVNFFCLKTLSFANKSNNIWKY